MLTASSLPHSVNRALGLATPAAIPAAHTAGTAGQGPALKQCPARAAGAAAMPPPRETALTSSEAA